MTAAFVLGLALAGCLTAPSEYRAALPELSDDDGDGFNEREGDCDDGDVEVHPLGREVCDGVDNDCDGEVDEAGPDTDRVWYPDLDGDGVGSGSGIRSCTAPGPEYVEEGGDCNEGDPEAWPGAPERCNGLDDDCDGSVDEEPTVDPPTWYPDGDGDGYGNAASGVAMCAAPAPDWVEVGGDCDDLDAAVNPSALETCNGLDDDCDGEADEPPVVGEDLWYPDEDGDGYGRDDALTAECAKLAGYVREGGDCDDGEASVHPGAAEVCNDGLDNDCDGDRDGCTWPAVVDMEAGRMVRGLNELEDFCYTLDYADVDGDGELEVVTTSGRYQTSSMEGHVGGVFVFDPPILDATLSSEADQIWLGESGFGGEGLGSSLVVSDVDLDGVEEVVVGAVTVDWGGEEEVGGLYVLDGPLVGGGDLVDVRRSEVYGDRYWLGVGHWTNPTGDVDGDGVVGFGTASEWASIEQNDDGILFLLDTVPAGVSLVWDIAEATVIGHDYNAELGKDFGGADFDGDGIDDLAVGVHNYHGGSGAVVVFRGPVVGDFLDVEADVVWDNGGEDVYNEVGWSLEVVGDATGDGLADLLVGDWGGDAVWLVQGETVLRDLELDVDAQVRFRADTDLSNGLGRIVEDVGDLDLDGWPDVFASARGSDPSDAYVFLGPFDVPSTRYASEADVHLEGDEDAGYYPWALGPGDVTADGGPDLLVCSDQYDNRTGALYIVEGTGW